MKEIEKQINDVLEGLDMFLDSHKSSAELVELKGKKAVIQLTGDCAECDSNCIEDALYEKIQGVEFVFI